MFKQTILLATLCISSVPVLAGKESMDIYCSSTESILNVLATKYDEKPMMRLRGDDSKYVIYHNSTTGTWSLVHLGVTQSLSCVIVTGTGIDIPRLPSIKSGSV